MREYFEGMTDPRQETKVKHSLIEKIMIVICALIAGCDVWEDIADYCRVKEGWFRQAMGLELANGIPSHDTMERIFAMLNPKEFQERFIGWVQHACGKQSRETISVDGKTMRGSGNEEQKPIHIVITRANKAKAVFGQMAVDGKTNEITAVPELLELLDIEGTIITADAMSCQREIVRKIRKKGHGRVENREYYQCTDLDFLRLHDEWHNLRSVGMMESRVTQGETTTEETHYYVSSLEDVKEFSVAARSHWGIENSLHWCLDVTFREDHSRMRKDNSAENFAVVQHIVLNILKRKDDKLSVARRRRRCCYDDAYLQKVLLSIRA